MSDEKLSVDPYDYLRVLATMMVFILHTYLFVDNYSFPTEGWEVLLRTPAWAGVWIFFIIGGFFAEKGFYDKRYGYTPKEIVRYYLTRAIKILIPTYLFVIMVFIIYDQSYLTNNPQLVEEVIIKMLTLRYNGRPGIDGLGATWYVFMIMWLYLLAPFFSYALKRLAELNRYMMHILLIIVVCVGLFYRLYTLHYNMDYTWYTDVYVNPLVNIDLFLSGMITYRICNEERKESRIVKQLRITSVLFIIITFATNCWFYCHDDDLFYLHTYQYMYPTIWLIATIFFLCVFFNESYRRKTPTVRQFLRKPTVFIGFLASISFELYLWHSVIGGLIGPTINEVFGPMGSLQCLLIMLATSFVISTTFAYMFHLLTGKITGNLLEWMNSLLKKSAKETDGI